MIHGDIINNGGDIQSTTFFLFSYMPAELYTSFDSKTTEIQMDEKKIVKNNREKTDIQFGMQESMEQF